MTPEASADLAAIYAPIEDDLLRLDAFLNEEFSAAEPYIGEILRHIARFRGKQLRPALLFLACRLGGRSPGRDVVRVAGVIEMIHTATLVHDDLLDDARLRRRVETVHRRWGERASVLIGDYVYSRAFHISTEIPGVANLLSAVTHTICEGELLQIGSRFVPDLGVDAYLEIISKKTASLHRVACQLGARFGGIDEADRERLERFGLSLGTAFQIIDDCLDYGGEEAVVGKSLGTDLHQGKVTLPLIHLRDVLDPADREWLETTLSSSFTADDEARVRSMVREHGVLDASHERAEEFVRDAKEELAGLRPRPAGSPAAAALESLALVSEYVLRRRR